MHSSQLLDHFQNPRNVGEFEHNAVTVEASNPACGDRMRLSARFVDGRVAEARFLTRGCTASIAAGSALTELIAGRNGRELMSLNAGDVEHAVGGLAPESKHASILCVDAVRALVRAAGRALEPPSPPAATIKS
ncbi:MAG: iron-sulfur cluster assembly scaffold protein [Bryobacteraceae bacterium]